MSSFQVLAKIKWRYEKAANFVNRSLNVDLEKKNAIIGVVFFMLVFISIGSIEFIVVQAFMTVSSPMQLCFSFFL